MTNNETVNQGNTNTATEQETSKTFTQEQLDAIVSERLNRERSKYADYEDLKAKATKFDEAEEAQKTELQKATEKAQALQAQIDAMTKAKELRDLKERVSSETGVPASLLSGETEEACKEQAAAIMAFKASGTAPTYPALKDKGEVNASPITKAEILAIKNDRERLKAIEQHIELFK